MSAFATEDYEAYEGYEAYEQETEATAAEPEAVAHEDPFIWLNELLRDIFGEVRQVVLTPEAMEIALADFDYLVEMILDVAPTQNILQRRMGVTAAEYFAEWREIIMQNFPVPSLLSLDEPELWTEAREDARSLAADYLATVLQVVGIELGSLGHFSVQPTFLVEQVFLAAAQTIHNGIELSQEEIDALVYAGVSLELVESLLDAALRFQQLHYDIFSTPSVLWFYDIDPSEFDLTINLSEFLGFEDPDNITTHIIEEGRIAYLRIASFLGNMLFDSGSLFPFYEEIQDFEHLIIDIRGNGGGWTNYFPSLVYGMLMSDSAEFFNYEFFIASEKTEGFFVNPSSMVGGILYDIVPAAEFVAQRGFTQFNQDDLALLDYAIIRYTEVVPSEYGIPFGGTVWLLVDGGSASASENAANLSIATGFATVVGEPTAGVTGVLYTFAALPNTGILFRIDLGYTVDQYGRSIEEFGVIPQILNAPGMDALNTVLARIGGVELPFTLPARQVVFIIPPPPPVPVAVVTTGAVADRTGFVSLRLEAYAHGYTVQWDGATNSALVISADGSVTVVAVSVEGTFNDNGTVFVTVEYAAAMFGAEVQEVVEEAHVNPLVGTWAWDEMAEWRYVFNADGTGSRGIAGIEVQYFIWSTDGTRLNIDLIGELSPLFIRDERWTFSISGDVLTIESLQVDGMVYSYIKQ